LGTSIDFPTAGGAHATVPLPGTWDALWERIRAAEQAAGRPPGSVALLAVSKAFGPAAIAALAALGQRSFGENYAQEALAKIEILGARASLPPLQWHFIGPIQSNKTRLIATHFNWVQSVDRLAVAQRLSAQRPAGMAPLEVLLQVNASGEATKSGIEPARLPALAQAVAALPRLRLRGIMAIPAPEQSPAGQHAGFAHIRDLWEDLRTQLPEAPDGPPGHYSPRLDTLSMGMSADFAVAIAEGSTMIRIGSALFGERP